MTLNNYNLMELSELRQYILENRKDVNAFYTYIDRSKASGKMITIDPTNPEWENELEQQVNQSQGKNIGSV